MAKIFVDGQAHEADAKKNLLEVCLQLGYDLPYFCWHPALGSVGACRQCAVKQFRNEEDKQGRLVMSCMTPADDGTRISISDPEAKEFRAQIIEWLMTNHPHDCPVCDEGGECHLQDMTVMTGHTLRDYRFPKRTFENQHLGPFLNHEMNRCIECYRCVRYYREYAGGNDLNVFASRNRVYFGRHEDGTLENEFSGNLAEVCPTGVFTDKTLKQHYTRKWDLQMAPSICVHCGVGCNVTPGERYGSLRRIVNRYNHHVNGYFLCDRGRFGYEFVNSEKRVHEPLARRSEEDAPEVVSRDEALRMAGQMLPSREKVIGIGSPRASLESNFALRALVGPERFYAGVADGEAKLVSLALRILREGPARTPSLIDIEQADAVLILGEDLTQTAPRIALALRQSVLVQPRQKAKKLGIPDWNDAALREVVQDEKGPLYIAAPAGTRLDDVAAKTYRAAPDDLARLGFAVAHELDAQAAGVPDLDQNAHALAAEIAGALKNAARPLVLVGVSSQSEPLLQAAANVARALCAASKPACLGIALPEANTLGLALLEGKPLESAPRDDSVETIIVLENDLFRRMDSAAAGALLDGARNVIALDHLRNETTDRASLVLPASTFAEGDGTLVSIEGRAQEFVQVFVPKGSIQESWRWLRDMAGAAGWKELQEWTKLDDARSALSAADTAFRGIEQTAPPATFRIVGQKIPRQPHRYSGRTAMLANINVSEPKPPEDPDSPFAFSMEGSSEKPPASAVPFFWAPGWNSIQAVGKFQEEIGGELRGGDPGVRLIEPRADGRGEYFNAVPAAFSRQNGSLYVVPLPHIFGSEELSILTPGVAERSPEPYLALHPEDAAALGVGIGDTVLMQSNGSEYRFPVKLLPDLARGLAGFPAGLPRTKSLVSPVWSALAKI